MKNNNFFWIMIALAVAVVLVGFGGKVFIDRVADQVILKLQKEYSPSPYGPGLDPDKVDPDKIFKKKDEIKRFKTTTFEEAPVQWDLNWEKQRTSFNFEEKRINLVCIPIERMPQQKLDIEEPPRPFTKLSI